MHLNGPENRLLINKRNNTRLSANPWSIPQVTDHSALSEEPILTNRCLFVRYDRNRDRATFFF